MSVLTPRQANNQQSSKIRISGPWTWLVQAEQPTPDSWAAARRTSGLKPAPQGTLSKGPNG